MDTSAGNANNAQMSNVEISHHPFGCGQVGKFSNGNLSFDGGKFSPKPSVAVTIAMWVKLNTIKGRQSLFDSVSANSSNHQGNYHFEVVDGRLRWFHRDTKSKIIFNVETVKPVVPEGQWAHLVGTYDMQEGWYS